MIYLLLQRTSKDLKNDLFIAPENIFPEMGYGSHPEELKKIVLASRERMTKDLQGKGYNEQKAAELANQHIKATFDIGHANTWKKYFKKKDENETPEQHDKRFQKWVIDQTDDLQKAGVLGHVHITDNFGYFDEHKSPGQGNAPIGKFIDKLKEKGYKGQVTVESAEQGHQAMTEMWRKVNSPVYRIGGASQSWTDVEGGYFGRTASPNFLFGPTAPDPQTWTLWSGVPLE